MADSADAAATGPTGVNIRDRRFRRHVSAALLLHEFILNEAIKMDDQAPESAIMEWIDFLYAVQLQRPYRGTPPRRANTRDWQMVGAVIRFFYDHLDVAQKRRFQLRLSTGLLLVMPIIFSAISIIALLIATFAGDQVRFLSVSTPDLQFAMFLVWLMGLGSMGSIAFVYVNALAIQVDSSVDLSNKSFIIMRIILGALFSLILTIPFGFTYFKDFATHITTAGGETGQFDSKAWILIVPFLLGFSTPLVLAVLNRLIEGVQTFFGVNVQKIPMTKDQTTDLKPAGQQVAKLPLSG